MQASTHAAPSAGQALSSSASSKVRAALEPLVDEVITFHQLEADDLHRVVRQQLDGARQLASQHGAVLKVPTDFAIISKDVAVSKLHAAGSQLDCCACCKPDQYIGIKWAKSLLEWKRLCITPASFMKRKIP